MATTLKQVNNNSRRWIAQIAILIHAAHNYKNLLFLNAISTNIFPYIAGSLLEPTVTGQIVASPKKENTLAVWQTKSANSDNTINRKNCSINNNNDSLSNNFVEIQSSEPIAMATAAPQQQQSSLAVLSTKIITTPISTMKMSLAERFRLNAFKTGTRQSQAATARRHNDDGMPTSPSSSSSLTTANDIKNFYCQCKHHIINWSEDSHSQNHMSFN